MSSSQLYCYIKLLLLGGACSSRVNTCALNEMKREVSKITLAL